MTAESQLLMIQFLRWIAERRRTYADVMEAWRTSCPRLSVWEDAQADGLVTVDGDVVSVSAHGHAVLTAGSEAGHDAGAKDGGIE